MKNFIIAFLILGSTACDRVYNDSVLVEELQEENQALLQENEALKSEVTDHLKELSEFDVMQEQNVSLLNSLQVELWRCRVNYINTPKVGSANE